MAQSLLPQVRRRLAERSRGGTDGFVAILRGSRWPRLARAGFASVAVSAGLAVGLMAGGPGSAQLDDGGVIEGGLGDRTDAMNLLEESSNLYGGDWALDQLWLAPAEFLRTGRQLWLGRDGATPAEPAGGTSWSGG